MKVPNVTLAESASVVPVTLSWERFEKLTDARRSFPTQPCVYVQADREGRAVRVGRATAGLSARYRGGTGYALDAAMHGSGNLVFVAALADALMAIQVEATLIWEHRASLPYNNVGKLHPPPVLVAVRHAGDAPSFRV